MFLLDGSRSVELSSAGGTSGNFKNAVVSFVKNVVKDIGVGSGANDAQVGVATFSDKARLDFNLGEHSSTEDVLSALDKVVYPKPAMGGIILTGFELVRDQMLPKRRAGAKSVLVVVTDGEANEGYDPAALVDKGPSGCTASKPCMKCQGDCDIDTDCDPGLRCYQRKSWSQTVPGCGSQVRYGASSEGDHDYCIDQLAKKIHDMGVEVYALGIQSSNGTIAPTTFSELEWIASSPSSAYVFEMASGPKLLSKTIQTSRTVACPTTTTMTTTTTTTRHSFKCEEDSRGFFSRLDEHFPPVNSEPRNLLDETCFCFLNKYSRFEKIAAHSGVWKNAAVTTHRSKQCDKYRAESGRCCYFENSHAGNPGDDATALFEALQEVQEHYFSAMNATTNDKHEHFKNERAYDPSRRVWLAEKKRVSSSTVVLVTMTKVDTFNQMAKPLPKAYMDDYAAVFDEKNDRYVCPLPNTFDVSQVGSLQRQHSEWRHPVAMKYVPMSEYDTIAGPPQLSDPGKGGDWCNSNNQCNACEGDCEGDADCATGLMCFQRDASSTSVRGCASGGDGDVADHDYCTQKDDSGEKIDGGLLCKMTNSRCKNPITNAGYQYGLYDQPEVAYWNAATCKYRVPTSETAAKKQVCRRGIA